MKFFDHVVVACVGYGVCAGLLFDTPEVAYTAAITASIVYAMFFEVRGRA